MAEYKDVLKENINNIRKNMEKAAIKANRNINEIKLCAACKTRTCEEVKLSSELPIDIFGENHVQELLEKKEAGSYSGKESHFIGHLQTNKVNKVVGKADVIESVDSERLLVKINAAAEKLGIVQDILFEINIGEEESKGGIKKEELISLASKASEYKNIRIRGLMAIPPFDASESETRAFFKEMYNLNESLKNMQLENAAVDTLSMGMSGDYETAIEEGATIVRIGTAIYGARDYSKKQ